MKILEQYIGRQLVAMILLVVIALLGVDLFFYTINELRFVGRGDYEIVEALLFITLTIPRKIYIMFPWSALLGTLLAFGNLAKNNELVAMRAATVSINKLSIAALKAGFILTLSIFVLGEIVAPASEKIAQASKTRALSGGQVVKTAFGVWVRNNNEFVHIGNMVEQELYNVKKYKFDSFLQLQEVIAAKRAYLKDFKATESTSIGNGQGKANTWILEDVQGTTFKQGKVENFTARELAAQNLVDLNIVEASQVKHLERLSIKALWQIIQNRASNELTTSSYEIALWTKIFQPFAILVMVYIAIPFVFGPLRQASMGLKLLTGVLVGFSFHIVKAVFAQLPTVIGLSPVIAMFLPLLIFFVFGYRLLAKVR